MQQTFRLDLVFILHCEIHIGVDYHNRIGPANWVRS